ncbi:NAD(P)H-dependent oxidoreductase [Sphingomonas rhizophila]|uniref:NAD(P)H-dependent oxidoreductase n=1 Tax=Sphingomonas rhizophila TaxID=2071607 RepID=A0A7G9SC79_9SPHN|nr:NADPH-dependent FMN reductase [Sphingomonas rhizophila]QNN65454.1 NAD(P)H-dependent oxidoreductase [Sphingomonas rhizophila]
MENHSIAIIVGSLRDGSINRKVARSMCALHDRLDCTIVEIGDLPLYNPDIDGDSPPEAYTRFRDAIRSAEGVLFVTPEYNRSVPGALKNAIDVGSRPYGKSVFAKKPAAIVTVSPGALGGFGANHHLRQSAVFLDMPVMQQPEAYLGHVSDDAFGKDGLLKDGDLKNLVEKLSAAFADWIDLIKAGREKLLGDSAGSNG